VRSCFGLTSAIFLFSILAVGHSQSQTIDSLSSLSGFNGTSVTISGSGFGATQGSSSVKFNGIVAAIISWSDTSISASVPSLATSGNVSVTVSGMQSNAVNFTVLPLVMGMTPASGAVGSALNISGSGFGATQGSGGVTLNGVALAVNSWDVSSVIAVVPQSATSGTLVLQTGAGLVYNGPAFTVVPAPSISSLSSTNGNAGAAITILGSHFGSTQDTGTISFNGTNATANSWSDGNISTTVPAGATTGNVVVTAAGGVASPGVPFTVQPVITSISPASGAIGSSVRILGSGFGTNLSPGAVSFNGVPASLITVWNSTSVTAIVAAGTTSGNIVLTTSAGTTSNGRNFNVVPPPSIISLSPGCGSIGTPIAITGTNFGATQFSVTFNGKFATIGSWSDTSISATVPSGATTGNVVVKAAGSVTSPGIPFTVTNAPCVTSLSPASGQIGSSVTIAGSNFGAAQGSVSFNGTATTVSSWSSTSITAPVPTGATTGNLIVTSAGGTASNPLLFTVASPPPVITFLTQPAGRPGMGLTIIGSNFGALQNGGTVTFNGLPAAIGTWSDGSITTTVPAGVHTGPVVVTTPGGASNGVQFTFAPGIRFQTQPLYITPDEINLEVGVSGSFKVVDPSGQPVTDATWSVDLTDLATIATDDPTLPTATLQALAPGEVTITATSSLGTAQAKATIYGEGLTPNGTSLWGFYPETQDNFFDFKAKSRRNSETDPFLYVPEDTFDFSHLSALDENGRLAWKRTLNPLDPGNTFNFLVGAAGTNDGGVLAMAVEAGGPNDPSTAMYRYAPDGTPLWNHKFATSGTSLPAIAPDGTVFVLTNTTDLIALKDTDGTEKFRFTPVGGSKSFTSSEQPGSINPDGFPVSPTNPWKPCADFFVANQFNPPGPGSGSSVSFTPLIGTEGSAYLMSTVENFSFNYDHCTISQVGTDSVTNAPIYVITSMSGQLQYNKSVQLLRVNSGGSAATQVGSVSYTGQAGFGSDPHAPTTWSFNSGASQLPTINWNEMVPDADGGVLMSWTQQSSNAGASPQTSLTKVLNDAPVATYSITAADQMATNDQGIVFLYHKGDFSPIGDSVTALDVTGAPKWTIAGTLLGATDDGGVMLQLADLSIVHADANGNLAPDVLAAADRASFMAIGLFQVNGLAGSVTLVPTNLSALRQLMATPWPVPKFANPQKTLKAQGEKTSEVVETGETAGCTGYDTDHKLDIATIMAPADGINSSTGQTVTATGNSFNFKAPKHINVRLTPVDPNALTLSLDDPQHPSQLTITVPGDNLFHEITLLGHGTDISSVGVLMTNDADPTKSLGIAFQGIVLPYRFWQLHEFAIGDASENVGSGTTPSATQIATQINRAFKGQANIEVSVIDRGLVDSFHWDKNRDLKMHFANHWDPPNFTENNEAGPLHNYITKTFDGATSPLLTQGWTMYAYYVQDFDNAPTEGFTFAGKFNRGIPSIIKTTYNLQFDPTVFMANLTGHEIGHKFGLEDRRDGDHTYLMIGYQPGNLLFKAQNIPCKLEPKEWKIANQP